MEQVQNTDQTAAEEIYASVCRKEQACVLFEAKEDCPYLSEEGRMHVYESLSPAKRAAVEQQIRMKRQSVMECMQSVHYGITHGGRELVYHFWGKEIMCDPLSLYLCFLKETAGDAWMEERFLRLLLFFRREKKEPVPEEGAETESNSYADYFLRYPEKELRLHEQGREAVRYSADEIQWMLCFLGADPENGKGVKRGYPATDLRLVFPEALKGVPGREKSFRTRTDSAPAGEATAENRGKTNEKKVRLQRKPVGKAERTGFFPKTDFGRKNEIIRRIQTMAGRLTEQRDRAERKTEYLNPCEKKCAELWRNSTVKRMQNRSRYTNLVPGGSRRILRFLCLLCLCGFLLSGRADCETASFQNALRQHAYAEAYRLYQTVSWETAEDLDRLLKKEIRQTVFDCEKGKLPVEQGLQKLKHFRKYPSAAEDVKHATRDLLALRRSNRAYEAGWLEAEGVLRLLLWEDVISEDSLHAKKVAEEVRNRKAVYLKRLDEALSFYRSRSEPDWEQCLEALSYWYPNEALTEQWIERAQSDVKKRQKQCSVHVRSIRLERSEDNRMHLSVLWENRGGAVMEQIRFTVVPTDGGGKVFKEDGSAVFLDLTERGPFRPGAVSKACWHDLWQNPQIQGCRISGIEILWKSGDKECFIGAPGSGE